MGLEIVEQVPDMDCCIIPIGGGGLIAGSAVAIKFLMPKCKIIVSNSFILSPFLQLLYRMSNPSRVHFSFISI